VRRRKNDEDTFTNDNATDSTADRSENNIEMIHQGYQLDEN